MADFRVPVRIRVTGSKISEHWDGQIIAIIVSGYDGDGAAALRGIKEAGGITIAQKPETAAHPDMPESAIDTGFIDYVLSPEDIARTIVSISQTAHQRPRAAPR
jgi:two-component system, chemotaxis family, protein-glutamate methylesterase/glutaminase